MILKGQIVDIISRKIFKGELHIIDNKISKIIPNDSITETNYILPGLVDAHIHVESSMLIPSEFARLATAHGTVATVSDPHEIANVMGIEGVNFMIENGKQVPFKFYFGAPSCVPATTFETSGASIDSQQIGDLLARDDIKYLSEMMNFPGVLFNDKEVWAKINAAKKYGKPIDGHAPGLKGEDAAKYVGAGITTDHECFTIEEAIDKIKSGMFVQIREGSAAKNYESLSSLIDSHPDFVMLCSDDKHPNDLEKGHVNQVIKRALADGYDFMNILQACILNPVRHYKLDIGLLQVGNAADMILVDNLNDFTILKTFVDGKLVAENGKTLIESISVKPINKFHVNEIKPEDLYISNTGNTIKVMQAMDGELITNKIEYTPPKESSGIISDTKADVLKIMVLNRYQKSKPAIGFIQGFGFTRGAIASSVAHDSHNIVAIGITDEEMVKAVNLVNESEGGVSWVDGDRTAVLELPVAGIMSHMDGYQVAEKYEQLDQLAKSLGTKLNAPYMTLSFMALLVIPELKLSDKGLFDGSTFSLTTLEV
ncbi:MULTISPECIES: adenine deaminase [unclassified Lentimicrobium]|uniref:adenine deaminase n=1 Tax=unclassified Lentimicrobium TaxID=2677434 RepID=UPI001556DD96|nr:MULTISPECIES: adenine deaminase [unclassified Lentimicrobium]NPD45989.1 adenine deaminase [Lentimicrobium sp. S6]NPD86787.1 adenine deaminase [Lentimicrobium sp. L6]